MGYTIMIGEACIERLDEYGREVRLGIERVTHPEAPRHPNDVPRNLGANERWPSYSGWADFARATDTESLWFHEDEGLLRPHPGVVHLQSSHVQTVREALARYRSAHPGAVPGFMATAPTDPFHDASAPNTPGTFDAMLARLEWVEWWMTWAIRNCRIPAVGNS